MQGSGAEQGSRSGRKPARATPRHLENAALHYLQRYATSAENLRRVLMRRVLRSAQVHGTDAEEGAATVERLLARFTASGFLDDRSYADAAARSLARRGRSVRAVKATLARKGVPEDLARQAVEALREEDEDLERKAAIAYARRRRLGPFRDEEQRPERRERDLASMVRAGYRLETAREIIDAADAETLLAEPPLSI